MAQTSWGEVATIIIGLVLVFVEIGRWAGGIEAKRKREPAALPAAQSTNGTPSHHETVRRLEALEKQNAQEHENMRREYRDMNTALQNWLGRLMH